MKKLLIVSLFVLMFSINSSAQSGGFGAGIMFGEPTGISVKSWLTKSTAWDAGLAWNFGEGGALHVHGDYLIHEYGLIKVSKGQLPLYYGFGARFLLASDTHVGIRGVVGLDYLFSGTPLDIFLEIVPIFDIVPKTNLGFNGALGIRYFFN